MKAQACTEGEKAMISSSMLVQVSLARVSLACMHAAHAPGWCHCACAGLLLSCHISCKCHCAVNHHELPVSVQTSRICSGGAAVLQDLVLFAGSLRSDTFTQLPQSLTRLFLDGQESKSAFKLHLDVRQSSWLARLTNLQELQLPYCGTVDLAVLSGMSKLKVRELQCWFTVYWVSVCDGRCQEVQAALCGCNCVRLLH